MTRNRVSAWAALALSLAANFYFMDRAHAQRVTKPRIPPVATELMTDAQRQRSAAVGTQDAINIELTMLNHPELSQDWEVFANHNNLVAMALNSFGVQLEPGPTGFPPGTR